MLGALLLIWVGFHVYGALFNNGGAFLTPRNLWNLSVQTSSIGIMATGMVLVIVTRNIDLSVGSLIGVTGMAMGILQVDILPNILGIGHWSIWIITTLFGIALGALIGALHGWLIAYRGIPSFIVTRIVRWPRSAGRRLRTSSRPPSRTAMCTRVPSSRASSWGVVSPPPGRTIPARGSAWVGGCAGAGATEPAGALGLVAAAGAASWTCGRIIAGAALSAAGAGVATGPAGTWA